MEKTICEHVKLKRLQFLFGTVSKTLSDASQQLLINLLLRMHPCTIPVFMRSMISALHELVTFPLPTYCFFFSFDLRSLLSFGL
jgi:hypothetical protein